MEINLTGIKAVIFDMDGTMINNMAYHQKAWKQFCINHGLEMTDKEFKEKISGKKNNIIFQVVFGKELTPDEIKKFTEEKEELYQQIYKDDIREIEGLSNLISLLRQKGLKLAIATTAPKTNRDFGLKALGLTNAFDVILGDEDVTCGKPHPEIYLKTAEKLEVEPEECLVFEDTPVGVEAAKNAGMRVIGILTSYTEDELKQSELVVDNFDKIKFV